MCCRFHLRSGGHLAQHCVAEDDVRRHAFVIGELLAQDAQSLEQLGMVEKIDDMPAGTIGFRASGKLTPEDYRDVPGGRGQGLGCRLSA